jgi:thiol-disulfide isomerase/thioredoxin
MNNDVVASTGTPQYPGANAVAGGDAPDYYALLQITPDASADDIAAAYWRQLEIYDPAHVSVMGDAFIATAAERRVALDAAYSVLRDPQRRFAYDRQLGLVGDEIGDRRGISNREVTFAVGGIVAGLLVLAAIWYAVGGREAAPGPAVVEVNHPAPSFKLRTIDGGEFDLSAHRGKVVLINFWGTWCEPCKEETPALQAAYTKLRDAGLVIVGVDLYSDERRLGSGEQQVRQFANRYGVEYPIALDETGQVARDYRLYPIPVSYFVDPKGNVRYIRIGQLHTADVEQLFRDLWQQHEQQQARLGGSHGAGARSQSSGALD